MRLRATHRLALGAAVALAALLVALIALHIAQLGPARLAAVDDSSVIVLDRNGRLLRAFTTRDGRWRLPADAANVDPRYLAMLYAYEDKRFATHRGVDPLALARAAGQFLLSGHVRSGASTLTMQVARLLEGKHARSLPGKFDQMLRAIEIERRLTKSQILNLYLELAPFGGNLEGVRAASLAYFGKEPAHLSPGEAALLVALPQAPEPRRPDLHSETARAARDRVLARALAAHVIDAAEATRARSEPVPVARKPFPQLAPHLSEEMVAANPGAAVHRLTLERALQTSLEDLARTAGASLGPRLSLAIIAADHRTGEILAYIGAPDYLDQKRFGPIDMANAVRSPGSTLKPLIYGLAFEAGIAHPDTLIDDKPTRFGRYAPKNFDDQFHGLVTVRDALRQSLNVPAVKMLAAVGPNRLTARMSQTGIKFALPLDAGPSLAVGLGGIGITLRSLAQLYCGIARGGQPVTLTYQANHKANLAPAGTTEQALLAPVADWYVQSILRGTAPPRNAKGGDIAYKTGTSYGFRDAWAVGFDGRHMIAVWVGRPDGVPEPGITGVGTAAPILFDAFARLPSRLAPFAAAPQGATVGADLPPPLKIFGADRPALAAGKAFAEPDLAIAFPPENAELDIERGRPVVLKAEGGVLPLTWLVDDAPVVSDGFSREASFTPAGKGFARVMVVDATGKADRVDISLR